MLLIPILPVLMLPLSSSYLKVSVEGVLGNLDSDSFFKWVFFFFYLLAAPHGMWDLSSLTRD